MPKNEDGEFELILGNRQLLSVFFIVVVLLGVFFTMGYIVGRNSGPVASTEIAANPKESKPLVVDSPAGAPPSESKPSTVIETRPQQSESKKDSEKHEEPRAFNPPPKPEPKKAPEPVKKSPEPEQPAAGTVYLQLTATTQHEAEVYADVLKKKGFKAITSIVPDKPGLVRVLVGPMPETSVNKTRSDLTAAGFPGDAAIKRAM